MITDLHLPHYKSPTALFGMHLLTRGIISLLRSANLILFSVHFPPDLLHPAHITSSQALSSLSPSITRHSQPFISFSDLKPNCFTHKSYLPQSFVPWTANIHGIFFTFIIFSQRFLHLWSGCICVTTGGAFTALQYVVSPPHIWSTYWNVLFPQPCCTHYNEA